MIGNHIGHMGSFKIAGTALPVPFGPFHLVKSFGGEALPVTKLASPVVPACWDSRHPEYFAGPAPRPGPPTGPSVRLAPLLSLGCWKIKPKWVQRLSSMKLFGRPLGPYFSNKSHAQNLWQYISRAESNTPPLASRATPAAGRIFGRTLA